MKRWFFGAIAILFAFALAGCPMEPDRNGGQEQDPTPGYTGLVVSVVDGEGARTSLAAIIAANSREFAHVDDDGNLVVSWQAWEEEETYVFIDFVNPPTLNGFYDFEMSWTATPEAWFGIALVFGDDEDDISSEAGTWHPAGGGDFSGSFDLHGNEDPILGIRINSSLASGTATLSDMVFTWREPPPPVEINIGGQTVSGVLVAGTIEGNYIRPASGGTVEIWLDDPVYIGDLSSITLEWDTAFTDWWFQLSLGFEDSDVDFIAVPGANASSVSIYLDEDVADWSTTDETEWYLISISFTNAALGNAGALITSIDINGDPSIVPEAVTVTPDAVDVEQGQTHEFSAAVLPAGAPRGITWTIEGSAHGATISDAGLLTVPVAVPADTTLTIRATATNHPTVYDEATVTVTARLVPTSVNVTPPTASVEQGLTQQFAAAVLPTGVPQDVIWTVEPPAAGTITAAGVLTLTGATPGQTVTVKAMAADTTVSGTAVVTVTAPYIPPPPPETINVTPNTVYIAQGLTRQFSAAVLPIGALQGVTWTVEPPTAGTISEIGLLTLTGATAGQTVTVRATAMESEIFGTATVTVTVPPTSVNVTPPTVRVAQGGTYTFTAAVLPSTARQNVTWAVTPTTAGTITAAGVLTLTGATLWQEVTVRATAVDAAVSGTASVTVHPGGYELNIQVVGEAGNGVARSATIIEDSRNFAGVNAAGELIATSAAWYGEGVYVFIEFATPLLLDGFYTFEMTWDVDPAEMITEWCGVYFGIALVYDFDDEDAIIAEDSDWIAGPTATFEGNFDLRGNTTPIVGIRINRGDDDFDVVTISDMAFTWREPPQSVTVTIGGDYVEGLLVTGSLDGDNLHVTSSGVIEIELSEEVDISALSNVQVTWTQDGGRWGASINVFLIFTDGQVALHHGWINANTGETTEFCFDAQWENWNNTFEEISMDELIGIRIEASDGYNYNVFISAISIE